MNNLKALLELLPKILGFMPEIAKYIKYIVILAIVGGIGYGIYYTLSTMRDPYKCYNNQLFEQKSVLSNVYIFNGDPCISGDLQEQQ